MGAVISYGPRRVPEVRVIRNLINYGANLAVWEDEINREGDALVVRMLLVPSLQRECDPREGTYSIGTSRFSSSCQLRTTWSTVEDSPGKTDRNRWPSGETS